MLCIYLHQNKLTLSKYSMIKKTAHLANFVSFNHLFGKIKESRTYASKSDQKDLFKVLSLVVGKKCVSESSAVRKHYSCDESFHNYLLPNIVVWPNSVEEVCEIAKICTSYKMSMIPFGTGTGLEGGVTPVTDAICVDLTNMNEIININIEDFDVEVRPGVTRKRLNHELKNSGLWFPVDPGADASLCGMVATGASGTNAVRYGTMKQNVLNLEVVLADGTLIRTGGARRCRKSSAGYNLADLFVGSEGTLGFITSATLRLHGTPEKSLSAVCSFKSLIHAVNSAVQIMQCNIPVARLELLDSLSMTAINKYSNNSNYIIQPTLFLEFHGSESSVKEQVERTAEITVLNAGSDLIFAANQEEVNSLWYARHNILYALSSLRPGAKYYSTDVCVPVTKLPDAIQYSVDVMNDFGLFGGVLGHVGDGNFHCLLMILENEFDLAKQVSELIGKKAIELEGSCTGEHGVGLGKKKLLIDEVGINTVKIMRLLKSTLDPQNLMNPNKIF